MAVLNRTKTITVSDTVTAQTLHDLIETATISGLGPADFDEAPFYVKASAATPNPSVAPFWLDTGWRETVFRVWAEPFKCWLTVGPDRFEIPFKNAAATEALMGALVIAAGSSQFSLAVSPSLNALGFLQADTPVDSFGPVCPFGIGWALYASNTSLAQIVTDGVAVDPRGALEGTCGQFKYQPNIETGSATSGIIWGLWLWQHHTGYTLSLTPLLSFITGPRNTVGF